MKLVVLSCCLLVLLMTVNTKASAVNTDSANENTKDAEIESIKNNQCSSADCFGCKEGNHCRDPCNGSNGGKCIKIPNTSQLTCCHSDCKAKSSSLQKCARHRNCIAADCGGRCCEKCTTDNSCSTSDCGGSCPTDQPCKCIGEGTCSCSCGVNGPCKLESRKCNGQQCDGPGQKCKCVGDVCTCVCDPTTCTSDCDLGGACNQAGTKCICNECDNTLCDIGCTPLHGKCVEDDCKCFECSTDFTCDENTCNNGESKCPDGTRCKCIEGKCTCVPNGEVIGSCETSVTFNINTCDTPDS